MPEIDRIDPVQILAKVGGSTFRSLNTARAFEVWVHLAREAGWDVVELPSQQGASDPTDLGAVMIEGIKYQIRYSPRVRRTLADDSTGHLTYRNILGYAAWAEPNLAEYKLD